MKMLPGPEWDETVAKGKVAAHRAVGRRAGGARANRSPSCCRQGRTTTPVKTIPQGTIARGRPARILLCGRPGARSPPHRQPEHSDTVPNGEVTRTSPSAGSHVTRNQPITIYYSIGPPIVRVPTIDAGTPLSDATATLKKAKFKVTTEERFSDNVDKGLVISVSPDDKATKFSTVTITVSKGPEIVRVPDIVLGDPVNDVKDALTEIGLVPDVVVVNGDESKAEQGADGEPRRRHSGAGRHGRHHLRVPGLTSTGASIG